MAVFEKVTKNGRTLFIFAKPRPSKGAGNPGTPAESVYDGDTIRAIFPGTQTLRFLGCDSAELAYRVPTSPTQFKANQSIGGALWEEYLNDPLRPGAWPAFPAPGLHPLVEQHLRKAVGPGCAANHVEHGQAGKAALAEAMANDMNTIAIAAEDFRVFAVFAHEILDSYGRPLVFANTDVADEQLRPKLTYNERMIAKGAAAPLYIWPNVDPFRGKPSVTEAALPPAQLRRQARTGKLGASRRSAAEARAAQLGIYDAVNPLRLQPFELRILGDRKLPSRWVIDLAADDDDPVILPPEGYPLVRNSEDRLYVPEEYVPLFAEHGWRAGILIDGGTV